MLKSTKVDLFVSSIMKCCVRFGQNSIPFDLISFLGESERSLL